MSLDELIARLKIELPKHDWLIRRVGDERQSMFPNIPAEPGAFFAHIFRGRVGPDGYAEDYWAYDDSPALALERAFEDAKAKRHRSLIERI